MLNSTVIKTLSEKWLSRLDTYTAHEIKFKNAVDVISFKILKFVENENQTDINKGEYGCYVGIKDIVTFVLKLDSVEYNIVKSELSNELSFDDDISEDDLIGWFVTQVIKDLVDKKQLLYVYDHQRVRSRIAEMVFYFSTLRQRIPYSDKVGLPFEYHESPNLAQMVKLSAQSRTRPKRSEELLDVLRTILQNSRHITPPPNLKKVVPANLEPSFELFGEIVAEYFKSNDVKLSQFQVDGFQTFFTSALSADFVSREKSYIIQSNTGSGKTEAFLFPILLYTILTNGQSGTKAILLYPRIDLCNNQLSRLAKYVYILNNSGKLKKPITISLQHGKVDSLSLECPYCEGHLSFEKDKCICENNPEHQINFIHNKETDSDIIITTPDSLHRRLMDTYGHKNIWNKATVPKFVVFDEAHIYSEQSGTHVSNVVRRLRHKIQSKGGGIEPIFIASSATIGDAKNFAMKFFSTTDAEIICPKEHDLEELGREYIIFVKAVNPRKHSVLQNGRERFTVATNLATMIQTAFCFYHTMRKYENKDRIMGFVDSIDVIKRLGDKLCDAERERQLFNLRVPDEKLGLENRCNGNCPHINCKNMPPHPYLNPCKIYEDGECWWVMEERDLSPMEIQIHKSGTTSNCGKNPGNSKESLSDDWNLMITTSALEVGFDHPDIIGTFQYMAPMNIPGFVQRVGRGGRSPTDMPISVVVLGSRPQDSFYFHHPTMLTHPSDEKLRITLDPTNKHIRAMHVTSFMYDYISSTTPNTSKNNMVTSCYNEMNTKQTREYLGERKGQLISEIMIVFDISEEEATEYYNKFIDYLESCEFELIPGNPDTEFIKMIRNSGKSADLIYDDLMEIKSKLNYWNGEYGV